MEKINWGHVVLCGLLTGGVCMAVSAPIYLLAFHESEFMQAMRAAQAAPDRLNPLLVAMPLNLLAGIWIMWLYAAIRPRYGSRPKAATVAGFAWWIMHCLAKANWGPFGLVSTKVLVLLLAAALPALLVATMVGARYYEE